MHKKAWGQAEQKLFKGLGQVFGLCALSTGLPKYLTSQVFLVGGFCTAFTSVLAVYKQGFHPSQLSQSPRHRRSCRQQPQYPADSFQRFTAD
jgi:hypothetical protein